MKKLIVAVICAALLGGCAVRDADSQNALKNRVPEIVVPNQVGPLQQYDEQQLFQLTDTQIAEFRAWYDAPHRADIEPHERLYNYLESYTYGFDYRGNTYTASEAMTEKAGNCLSLAMMTTALARVAGIETGFQMVNATPVFKQKNNVLLLSYHVRTYLYDPNWQPKQGVLTLIRPRLVVDYFPNRYDVPGDAVSEALFMSMYYRNLAADALLENDTRNAFWLTRKALELAPEDAENINLMAIIYRRLAMPELSEQYYQYGMAVAQNNTNMLSNYAILLESQNRTRDAEKIRQRLLDFPDNNPYAWIKLGHEAYQEENHSRAINYYKKAMALAPYLDEIYFGLAKSLYRRGEYAKAAQAMRVAAEKSWEQSERNLYYAKLSALQARRFDPEKE
ncbi:tetratricopeptide repeat protein [Planctobacterium marinum]|uniref:tetratricopeptide repeat protein n=1 Tax=Planctobacterium marinum TaxID=1631968 RepID=UPI001E4426A7|nr:tetratricopeptide repeat protein [Planctobacterium marinum]MCC2605426.1 hypothetical protein [Planctobacterium marinum]